MCRLLYIPANVQLSRKFLRKQLARLVASQGGHGNGLAYSQHNRMVIHKGVNLSSGACADLLLSASDRARLWHTRRVSCGHKTNTNCHPFLVDGTSALAHNGHWHQGALAAAIFAPHKSDTLAAVCAVRNWGWSKFVSETANTWSGVWLLLCTNGLYVNFTSGSLWKEQTTEILCSEPFDKWGQWKEVRRGSYTPDEKIETYAKFASVPVIAPKTVFDHREREDYHSLNTCQVRDIPPPISAQAGALTWLREQAEKRLRK